MALTPKDCKYSKDHEWIRVQGSKAKIGITDHAQKQLGDIVYVELPRTMGDRFSAQEPFGSLESVKAVTEVYMPVSGTVAALNDSLNDSPERVNEDPFGDGWLMEITVSESKELDDLLSAAEYEEFIKLE